MKKPAELVLDGNDKAFVETSVNGAINRNIIKALVYLASVDEATGRDIELGTSLSQPEVSIAMGELRDQGWTLEREVKSESGHSPVKCYKLAAGIKDIIRLLEERKCEDAQVHRENIRKLRPLSDNLK
jgi:predicted transcriptional regulator